MYITDAMTDDQYAIALQTFVNVAALNATVLNLTPTEVATIANTAEAFRDNVLEVDAKKFDLRKATSSKNDVRSDARTIVSNYAKEWRANNAISDGILANLQLPPHKPPVNRTPPTTPTELVLSVDNVGVLTLRWNRNGNKPTTIFEVETAESSAGPWATTDVTTKTKITYEGTPGVPVWFRVKARRANFTSFPSMPISMWDNGSGTGLTIAA